MGLVYATNGKIIFNKIGDVSNLPCPTGCCGREPPGVCCSGVWHDTPPECGQCCYGENAPNGIWVPSDLPLTDGICCGGEWYPPEIEGDCCRSVWYPKNAGCPEGQVFKTWGLFNECCGCVNEEDVPFIDSFCCPYEEENGPLPSPEGCAGACCVDCECVTTSMQECADIGGQFIQNKICTGNVCPAPCCVEDEDCNVICNENIPINECVSSTDCATGEETLRSPGECGQLCSETCLGACCENGEYIGQKTQEECNIISGCWSGPGSIACVGECLTDSGKCCEKKVSKGTGLTFSKPAPLWNRCKNCSILVPETLKVTITGTTDSPILIHGTPFGEDNTRCSIDYSFLICWNHFNIEPVPCETSFRYLDIEVCWQTQATDIEILEFSGCNNIGALNTIWLGGCIYDCVTTLLYNNSGHTSNVKIELYGNAIIEANGTGPLVLTNDIEPYNICVETLTITGNSIHHNEISGAIKDYFLNSLEVIKTGSGVWKLSGLSSFSNGLKVKSGTIIIGQNVGPQGASPVGNGNAPIIGDTNSGAKFLLEGKTYARGLLSVISGTGTVVLGGIGNNISAFSNGISIEISRDITLQASTGGEVIFGSSFTDLVPGLTITIGSIGEEGIVTLESLLPTSLAGVDIAYGTLQIPFLLLATDPFIASANFTNTTLTVNFNAEPNSGDQFQILPCPTIQSYSGGNLILNGTSKIGTYNSSTSTLTIS